jgi:hypothetical protein
MMEELLAAAGHETRATAYSMFFFLLRFVRPNRNVFPAGTIGCSMPTAQTLFAPAIPRPQGGTWKRENLVIRTTKTDDDAQDRAGEGVSFTHINTYSSHTRSTAARPARFLGRGAGWRWR